MPKDEALHLKSAQEVLRDTDRVSYGVVRILSDSAGTPGEEREYEQGDEALVEAGQAEWVVGVVHSPEAGRRLDSIPGAAEREAAPLDGVETYPPAEPTTGARRAEARREGYVDAHVDEGAGEKLAARRAEIARNATSPGADSGDAKAQAAAGGLGARSGPATKSSDLAADKALAEAGAAPNEGDARKSAAKKP